MTGQPQCTVPAHGVLEAQAQTLMSGLVAVNARMAVDFPTPAGGLIPDELARLYAQLASVDGSGSDPAALWRLFDRLGVTTPDGFRRLLLVVSLSAQLMTVGWAVGLVDLSLLQVLVNAVGPQPAAVDITRGGHRG